MKNILFLMLSWPLFSIAQEPLPIIPAPVTLERKTGYFELSGNTAIQFEDNQKVLKQEALFLQGALQSVTGHLLPLQVSKPSTIRLELKKIADIGDEGYTLDIRSGKVVITANSKQGIFHGIQSLLQTIPDQQISASIKIPSMMVKDYPRFKYRGMHLDVGRHFFPLCFVKKYIDLLATYKFNYFHWHLTEDQGWRIEIKKYPALTTKGAYRNGTIVGSYPGTKNNNLRYGGFYTQNEVKEVVAYALQRGITVVPEIEMPGHSSAAIAAYPWLSCFPTKPSVISTNASFSGKLMQQQGALKQVQETWGVFDDIFCAGNDSTFQFLEGVLDEVLQLFPSKYIHIGGDEAPKKHWAQCSRCQARIKREGLKDEHELQSYFIQRMEKYINKKGRTIIGWDEILEGGLAPNAIVMSWRGEAGGIEAAKQLHDVIMTPGNPVYFDHYQGDPASEPMAIGGFNTLKKVYNYEPIPNGLNAQQATHILGSQANLWTEYIPTTQHAEYMVLPRMLALSEVVWSPKENKDWEGFNQRLQVHFRTFEQKGWNYSKGNFRVTIQPMIVHGQLNVALNAETYQGSIVYTTDGSTPTAFSPVYHAPFSIHNSCSVKASVLSNGIILSAIPAQQNFTMHSAVGKQINYTYPVSTYYQASGPSTLIDGVRGGASIGQYWHGFNNNDLIATIDLGETKPVQKILLGCMQRYNDWIFLPQSVKFEVSENGSDFQEIANHSNTNSLNEQELQYDFKTSFSTKLVRYIRVTAVRSNCPKGHNGEGNPGWIFADEIVVE